MQITTDRLILRPLCMADKETVDEYAGAVENTKYMFYLPNETLQATAAFLASVEAEWKKEKPDCFEFAIVFKGRQIGATSICINDEGRQKGEIGWIINKKYWNQGYASEAALALLEYAKTNLNLKSVVAHCDYRNTASYKLMEKIGMKLIDNQGTRTYNNGETAKELTYLIEL